MPKIPGHAVSAYSYLPDFTSQSSPSNSILPVGDACNKWRMLEPGISSEDLPDLWYCKMNKGDPERSRCEAEERDAAYMATYYERRLRDNGDEDKSPPDDQSPQGIPTDFDVNVGAVSPDPRHTVFTSRDEVLQTLIHRAEDKRSASDTDSNAVKMSWVSRWDFTYRENVSEKLPDIKSERKGSTKEKKKPLLLEKKKPVSPGSSTRKRKLTTASSKESTPNTNRSSGRNSNHTKLRRHGMQLPTRKKKQ